MAYIADQISSVWPNFDFNIRRDHGKNSLYEPRVHESVDDSSLSYAISRKLMEKIIQFIKG